MQPPTEGELAILGVLWRRGAATVREVNDRLNEDSDKSIGYTTTLKLMQLMADKGLVSRDTSARSHVYTATAERERTQQGLLRRFVESTFGGSRTQLVLRALGEGSASPAELAQIKQLIEQLEKEESHD
ncbi:BlaI/MecI/CopY family transcriptional regulator [Lewinella sp. JB7]|uniref:BlaI/MecI/CopY family transcriptional regulator n=1 Tax=Lewinella sp. JB7 TaxID=2962887 RepID=UPI0020C9A05D|nr:BlaI/MecI/CopY family transcriptional regulator [Lewinella sp. JB7]MCP9234803.1 BlaI/MecI/CopY family transcriptional regulator [Lewinella sp. JB7]